MKTVIKIAKYFDVTLDSLIGEGEPMEWLRGLDPPSLILLERLLMEQENNNVPKK